MSIMILTFLADSIKIKKTYAAVRIELSTLEPVRPHEICCESSTSFIQG
jgi:hypothetical protein